MRAQVCSTYLTLSSVAIMLLTSKTKYPRYLIRHARHWYSSQATVPPQASSLSPYRLHPSLRSTRYPNFPSRLDHTHPGRHNRDSGHWRPMSDSAATRVQLEIRPRQRHQWNIPSRTTWEVAPRSRVAGGVSNQSGRGPFALLAFFFARALEMGISRWAERITSRT